MSQRFDHSPDLTLVARPASPGHTSGRYCWTCKAPRPELGGRVDKRTRMWNCKRHQPERAAP